MKKVALLLGTFLPSGMRLALWKALGFRVGRGCRVSPLSVVVADEIVIEDGAVIEPLTLIFNPKKALFGERSRVASFVRIVGFGELALKAQCFVGLGCLIDTTCGFELGRRSQLGPRGVYYSHGATGLTFSQRFPERFGPVVIEDDVWVGMAVVVYPKVTIGKESVVFAGLPITADVPARVAVTPGAQATRTIPVGALKVRVTNDYITDRIRQELDRIAKSAGVAVEELPDGERRVVVARGEIVLCSEPTERARSVQWVHTLITPSPARTPVFEFGTLTIHGPPTDLSDWVADQLASHAGIHFAYVNSASA